MQRQHLFGAVVLLAGALCLLVVACDKKTPTTDVPSTAPVAFKDDDTEPYSGADWFADVSKTTGIDFQYRNGETKDNLAIIESLGGGLALIDYDRDGLLDIYLCGGGDYEGKTVVGAPGRLYKNLGKFQFKDVTKELGLDKGITYSHGTAVGDINCDGYPDLLVTGYNRVVLYLNKEGKGFEDITEKAGLTERLWSSGAAFADLDGDGFPELYVCHYGDWGFDTNHPQDCKYDGKTFDVCPPKRFKPLPHYLYRNNKNNTFTNITDDLKLRKDGKGLGVIIADYNGDGRPDLYVANDTDDNFLYLNKTKDGKLALDEIGSLVGVARDNRAIPNGSMGLDVGDPLRTGKPALFVTNYEGELHALYAYHVADAKPASDDDFSFDFISHRHGLNALGHLMVGWGTAFVDFDRDGWEDLIIAHGHAIRYPQTGSGRQQKAKLLRNEQGKFVRISNHGGPYFKAKHNGRGLAVGDLDNDGHPDVVFFSVPDPKNKIEEPVAVLKNTNPTKFHWVGVELQGAKNRSVVGGTITVECGKEKYTRFVKSGGSYASVNDPRYVIGIADATKVDAITVRWPNGTTQQWNNLDGDRYWKLTEGDATAK